MNKFRAGKDSQASGTTREQANGDGPPMPHVPPENPYRYVIVAEGVVRAENKAEAEAAAFQAVDEGRGVFKCEVEPLTKERDE